MLRISFGVLLVIASTSTAGPTIGRSFPDANCAFSLPDADWEWLDPRKAPPPAEQAVAFARNKSGVYFWLRIHAIAAGEGVGPTSYENLEKRSTAGNHNWTKVSSKHVTFKGIPAFQIDGRQKENKSAGRFLFFFADNRAYVLCVQTPASELGAEGDAILERFAFLSPPHAMMEQHQDGWFPAEEKTEDQAEGGINGIIAPVAGTAASLGGFGLVILVLFGAWMIIRMRG
jgi:hypothetical protein